MRNADESSGNCSDPYVVVTVPVGPSHTFVRYGGGMPAGASVGTRSAKSWRAATSATLWNTLLILF